MKLLFRQRMFSWFDSYDVTDEYGNAVYTVQGKPSWGHRLEIYDAAGNNLGTVKEELFTLMPRFALYMGETCLGEIRQKWTFLKPVFTLNCNGWQVEGNFMEWNYQVTDPAGALIMTADKEIFHWTDTYVLTILRPENALLSLMIVLAIDAAKCSRGNG